jgi:hypothetical protein
MLTEGRARVGTAHRSTVVEVGRRVGAELGDGVDAGHIRAF